MDQSRLSALVNQLVCIYYSVIYYGDRFISGPVVCIENENSIVNFGNIQCGRVSTGLIHLINKSNVSAIFQVYGYVIWLTHQFIFTYYPSYKLMNPVCLVVMLLVGQ